MHDAYAQSVSKAAVVLLLHAFLSTKVCWGCFPHVSGYSGNTQTDVRDLLHIVYIVYMCNILLLCTRFCLPSLWDFQLQFRSIFKVSFD